MKLSIRLMVTTLAALAVATPAFAQRTPPTPEERAATFKAADKDESGKLDLAEFKTTIPAQMLDRVGDMLPQIFGGRDTNGDGGLDLAEFSAPMQRPGG